MIVAFSDVSAIKGGKNAVVGDILIISSTVCTALYMVFYAKYMKAFSLKNIFLFLGCVGFANLTLFWPGLVLISLKHLLI